ncbi:GMP synthase (glutamine-hydrolyzing), partial [Candidatus Roizmanbacteria bacterium CG_4_10_14_0_8_um_filter_36_36]
MIYIIDFGSQTTHLIGRRVRDFGVRPEIVLPKEALSLIKKNKPKGIILSGGPSSVYGEKALLVDKKIFSLGIPILGICYGLEVVGHLLGGKVASGKKKEYGPTSIKILAGTSVLFKNIPKKKFKVWMSHFDQVVELPKGMVGIGSTDTVKYAAFSSEEKKIYGIMFHPEVHHTEYGKEILRNFVFNICGEKPVLGKEKIKEIKKFLKQEIGDEKAVCALSGGIDSSVSSYLTHQVIGKNLTCYYVDTGLMREGETKEVINTFK